jgi:hypothetical protein
MGGVQQAAPVAHKGRRVKRRKARSSSRSPVRRFQEGGRLKFAAIAIAAVLAVLVYLWSLSSTEKPPSSKWDGVELGSP